MKMVDDELYKVNHEMVDTYHATSEASLFQVHQIIPTPISYNHINIVTQYHQAIIEKCGQICTILTNF
jgi:hypothetical protein